MTIKETYEYFTKSIHSVYVEREANSIGRIVFEDEFSIHALNSQRPFPETNQSRLEEIIKRLLTHEPIQYILGEADFYGNKFKVNPNVLIPRQETEELVYWVNNTIQKEIYEDEKDIFYFKNFPRNLTILDIGTGSGCIPITLKKLIPEIEITATDVSSKALDVARQNAKLLETEVHFKENNILDVTSQKYLSNFHIIISNPPYIPYKEKKIMPERVLKFEPNLALFVNNDNSILFYKTIARFAFYNLERNGFLFFEINEYNANEVVTHLETNKYREIILENDINGKPRMIRAIKPKNATLKSSYNFS